MDPSAGLVMELVDLFIELKDVNCSVSPTLEFHRQIPQCIAKRPLMGESGKVTKSPLSALAHGSVAPMIVEAA
jgi:hypothetical protein